METVDVPPEVYSRTAALLARMSTDAIVCLQLRQVSVCTHSLHSEAESRTPLSSVVQSESGLARI